MLMIYCNTQLLLFKFSQRFAVFCYYYLCEFLVLYIYKVLLSNCVQSLWLKVFNLGLTSPSGGKVFCWGENCVLMLLLGCVL